MTVREHLNKKITPVYVVMLICFILFGIFLITASATHSLVFLPFVPFLGYGACIIYLYYGIRCPRCRSPIAYLTYMNRGGYFRLSKNIKFCPFCGLEMDENRAQVAERQQ